MCVVRRHGVTRVELLHGVDWLQCTDSQSREQNGVAKTILLLCLVEYSRPPETDQSDSAQSTEESEGGSPGPERAA